MAVSTQHVRLACDHVRISLNLSYPMFDVVTGRNGNSYLRGLFFGLWAQREIVITSTRQQGEEHMLCYYHHHDNVIPRVLRLTVFGHRAASDAC